MPVPPPQPTKKTAAIVVSVVVVLAVVAGGLAISLFGSSAGQAGNEAEIGECVGFREAGQMAITQVLDCSDPGAVSKIAAIRDGISVPCPQGDYNEFYSATGTKLCLVLNVQEGDCIANTDGAKLTEMTKVSCTDPGANVVILKVVFGQLDAARVCAQLPDSATPIYYSDPPTVLCLGAPLVV